MYNANVVFMHSIYIVCVFRKQVFCEVVCMSVLGVGGDIDGIW